MALPRRISWRELDDAGKSAATIPARIPLGTLARLDTEVKQITHASS